MDVREFTDPVEFRRFADPLLLADEARNNLIIGVSGTLIDRPEVYEGFRLWCVQDDGVPLLAAMLTPPRDLILSDAVDKDAVSVLVSALAGIDLPGVVGNEPWSRLVAEGLDPTARRRMAQGVFRLDSVEWPGDASGSSRPARLDESALLTTWLTAFVVETNNGDDPDGAGRVVESRLEASPELTGFWVWENGGNPVSVSGYQRPTPSGMTIGPVYTPPGNRGMGYATALVAQQSQWLLDQGRKACFLYTDLSNPTSNSIYQRIGYRQVAESSWYVFDPERTVTVDS